MASIHLIVESVYEELVSTSEESGPLAERVVGTFGGEGALHNFCIWLR